MLKNYYLKYCFLLGWISSVKGQNCGSCVAFATMGALEATLIKAGADPDSVDLSEQWLLDCSPRGGCSGASTPVYGMWMRDHAPGLMHEDDYPVRRIKPDGWTSKANKTVCPVDGPYWSPGYKIDKFIFTGGIKYNSDESMMMRIMEYGSILMAIKVGKGFGGYKSGVMDMS